MAIKLDSPVSLPRVRRAKGSEARRAGWPLLYMYKELPHYSALTCEQRNSGANKLSIFQEIFFKIVFKRHFKLRWITFKTKNQ